MSVALVAACQTSKPSDDTGQRTELDTADDDDDDSGGDTGADSAVDSGVDSGDDNGGDSGDTDPGPEPAVCAGSQFGSAENDGAEAVEVVSGVVYVAGQRDCGVDSDGRTAIACKAFLRAASLDDPSVTLWEATLDSSQATQNDQIRAMATDGEAIYVVGQTDGDMTPPCAPLSGTTPLAADAEGNAFLIRYPLSPSMGSDGQPVCDWYDLFGTKNMDEALAVAVHGDDLWIAGGTIGTLGAEKFGDEDAFVRHVDLTATEQPCTYQFGGSQFEEAMGIAAIDGQAVAVGWTANELEAGKDRGAEDLFLVHVDTSCQSDWIRQFGSDSEEAGQAVAIHDEGGTHAIYLSGRVTGEIAAGEEVNPGEEDNDLFLIRMEWDGASTPEGAWMHQVGTELGDAGSAVVTDATHVYVAGVTGAGADHTPSTGTEDAYLVAYRHDGSFAGDWTYGSSDGQTDAAIDAVGWGTDLVWAGMSAGALAEDTSDAGETTQVADAVWVQVSLDGTCE